MTVSAFDAAFAQRLREPKEALISDDGHAVDQLGARSMPFDDAPPWPELDGLVDDAIIETFVVDADGNLSALSEAAVLAAWRPRAEALVQSVLDVCTRHEIELDFPLYLTGSITPVSMLEGNPHLDDDQLVPGAGVGLVAINGQHAGPRVAGERVVLERAATPGPLRIPETAFEDFRSAQVPAGRADEIAVLAQFGQLHAGPSSQDVDETATHRQLLVLRGATRTA